MRPHQEDPSSTCPLPAASCPIASWRRRGLALLPALTVPAGEEVDWQRQLKSRFLVAIHVGHNSDGGVVSTA